ncbi:uncharacterized protein LOC129901562 isoform X1 [Solanum dulcamara]|uniref:uncharacterized protein LOC129901562 isoform X1 n=1 Tax=Solanum dulcamara TaxID=45834 RepID=UPI0024850302|nr:uncharacterized protein LOC129901562 isoform X1 [Solanum dulcamara]
MKRISLRNGNAIPFISFFPNSHSASAISGKGKVGLNSSNFDKVKSLDDAVNLFNQMVDAGQVTSTGIVAPSYVQKVAPSVSSIRLYVQPTICLEMLHQALVITSFGSVVSEGRLIPMDVLLLYWKSGLTWVLISIYQLRSVTKGKTTTLALDSQLENRGGCLNRD